jgi:hypothetical protein
MSVEALVLTVVLAAFAFFAALLHRGERRTRGRGG